jgi:hypothetical protein
MKKNLLFYYICKEIFHHKKQLLYKLSNGMLVPTLDLIKTVYAV